MSIKKIWKLWAKAIGPKEGSNDTEADAVAIIRTILIVLGLLFSIYGAVTNTWIIMGIEKHWNDK